MSIKSCGSWILLVSILAGGMSSCSILVNPDTTIAGVTVSPNEPTSIPENAQLFVPQTDAIINSVNASSLAPSEGVTFPGTIGFTWLSNNKGAALVNQDEVVVLKATQPGIGSQSSTTELTQTISSTVPSMLIASSAADRIAWVSDGSTVNTLEVSSTNGNPFLIQTESPITGLALTSSGDKVAFGTFDGRTVIQAIADSTVEKTWTLPTWLTNLTFSPDGSQLAGVDLENFTMYVINASTGEVVQKIEWLDSATPALYGIHLSPDWRNIAWVAQNVVQVMNVKDHSIGPQLVHQDAVRSISWSPDGKLLATGAAMQMSNGLEPAVLIWNASSGELLNTIVQQVAVQSVAFSPDGRQLAIVDTMGNLQTWSISP